MNTSQPAQTLVALTERLIAIRESKATNEMELKRLENSARQLLAFDPGNAHMVLGMIADLKGDVEAALHQHEQALAYGRTPVRIINYAGTLGGIHRPQDALEQLMTLLHPPYPETTALRQAIHTAHGAGRLYQAAALLGQYRQLGLPENDDITLIGKTLPLLLETADALKLSDHAMALIQAAAWAAIREQDPTGCWPVQITDRVLSYDGLSINRTYWLPIAVEEGFIINGRMIELLAEGDQPPSIEDFCPMIRGRGDA